MEIGEFYQISILDTEYIQIRAYGERYKRYKYDDVLLKESEIKFYKGDKIYVFLYEKELNMYRLTDISDNKVKKKKKINKNCPDSSKESYENRIKRYKNMRCEKISNYFKAHRDEFIALKRYFDIEGVRNIENIRFEIRRMMNFGLIYSISLDELADILRKFGVLVKN